MTFWHTKIPKHTSTCLTNVITLPSFKHNSGNTCCAVGKKLDHHHSPVHNVAVANIFDRYYAPSPRILRVCNVKFFYYTFLLPTILDSSTSLIVFFLSSPSRRTLSWLAFSNRQFLSCRHLLCWLTFYHTQYLSCCCSLCWLSFYHSRYISCSCLFCRLAINHPWYLSCHPLLCGLTIYQPRYISCRHLLCWLAFYHLQCIVSSALLMVLFLYSPTIGIF